MRRSPKARRSSWLTAVAVGLLLAAACGKGGVVGGDCIDGFISCDGTCVDPFADSLHCGVCDNACDDGLVCDRGECGEGGSSGAAGADGATGGSSNGGSANGGSANGGTASGGSANGGSSAMGGSAGFGTGGDGTGGGTGGNGTGGGTGGDGTGGGTGGNGTGGGSGGNGTGGGSGGNGTGGGTGGDGTGGGTGGNGTGGSGTGGSGTGGGGTGGGPSGSGGVGGGECLPPFDTPAACGDCDTECNGATPVCAPAGGGSFECVPVCDPPLTNCSGTCVDLDTDPRNCGICGNVCPSGVCVDGICQGATPGHVVYICMNYEEVFQVSAQTTLLGNAVFLSRNDPVRVLAYSDHALRRVMNTTDRAIRWAGEQLNRQVEITRVTDVDTIETDLVLSSYDVFLVYDQQQASPGQLAAAGSQLAVTLEAFTVGGGVAVLLSGATGAGEMGEFATAAGLAAIGVETPYSQLAYVRANADVISVNVISPFQTLASSCTFATTETPSSDVVFVVTDTPPGGGTGAPIVLHKVVTP